VSNATVCGSCAREWFTWTHHAAGAGSLDLPRSMRDRLLRTHYLIRGGLLKGLTVEELQELLLFMRHLSMAHSGTTTDDSSNSYPHPRSTV